MKKLLCILLAVFMLISFTACGEEPAPQINEYIPNDLVEVAVAYICKGQANIVTRQITDAQLKKITLVCVFYDADGNMIGQQKMINCTIKDEGPVVLWQTDCPENAVYVDSTVYATYDASDNAVKAERIDLWEKAATAAFDAATHKQTVTEKLSTNAALAVTNDYARIGTMSWRDLDVIVEIEPLSTNVKAVYLFALWFDKDDQPVKTDTCAYCENGEPMLANVSPEGAQNFIFKAPENAYQAKMIVQSVDLNDGTKWLNPYCYEWIVLNCENAQ